MNNAEMIRELRALTSAGMKDCRDALEESNWDLQKAVDIVKVKGLNIADGRTGRVAADGAVSIYSEDDRLSSMAEVNSQTDFVSKMPLFVSFARAVAVNVFLATRQNDAFVPNSPALETIRTDLVSTTKENIVVRRWWAEEATSPNVRVFSYVHSNNKIGVLLSLQAPNEAAADSEEFRALGNDLAMQIAAMNPLAVSPERLAPADLERQKAIFEAQLKEDVKPKPQAMWPKILEGKMRKWNSEVCLLEQESVVVQKTLVKQVVKDVGTKLGGEITIVNFHRCQVGEGIEVKKDNLADEVAKMITPEDSFIQHLASKVKV
jgi:elongation factor Ts